MHYLNGEWVKGEGELHQTTDLMDGSIVWQGNLASDHQVDTALLAAKEASNKWKDLGFEKRLAFLEHYTHSLEKQKDEIAHTISLSMGKPFWEAKTEVGAMINKLPVSKQAYLERTGCVIHNDQLKVTHHPHGVCVIFSPFNFPGHLLNGHLIPALLAGNTVVVKGSEKTPLVSEKLFQLLAKIHLPPGVVNLLQGKAAVGKRLATSDQLDAIFFTGSYAVGSQLEKQMKPGKLLALEMGGNNPLIVGKIKDIEAAVWVTLQSAYLTSGQRCTCARRLIVVDNGKSSAFLTCLKEKIARLKVGDFRSSPEPFMGPVVDLQQAKTLLTAQELLVKQGGKPLHHLVELKKNTPLLSPGLIDVTEVEGLKDEEWFGPLLQVIHVRDLETALCVANETKYGLSATLLSHSKKEHELYERSLKVGILNWNTPTCGASSLAPFGGSGLSGNYRPSGYYAADYCAFPVAQNGGEQLILPDKFLPGVQWTK